MKVKVIVEFNYGEQISKDMEQLARKRNVPIEDIARVGMQDLLDECYFCMDNETYSVSAELIEE